jgi:transcriptional regulator with XRE-family HTH domain
MEPAIMLAFGPLLKRYRRAARLTQAQLAERAGFSVDYISKLERGVREPQRATVALLADALGLSITDSKALENTIERSRVRPADEAIILPTGGFLGAIPTGPLVGRGGELDAITALLGVVANRQGRLLVLVGEAGVGKTRLAQEITLLARAQGYRILTGRSYEPQHSVAYYPFTEALASVTQGIKGISGEGSPALSERWPEVARILPHQPQSIHTPTQIGDRAAQQRLFWQVTDLLSAVADRTPLALVLDDVHWADSASLDLLQHLARHTRDRRILLAVTCRDVEVNSTLAAALHDLGREEVVEQIVVRPLGRAETTALISVTLGVGERAQSDAAAISPPLAHFIQQRSEGNPFFVRQLTRALQEQGNLQFENGQWRLTASALFPPPETIRLVIDQRTARLTALTQDLLREASVLGQYFAFADLELMSGRAEQEIEEALEEAIRAGVIREGQPDHYHFNHALIADTLYADLSTRRKRRLHRTAAGAIERSPDHERRAAELTYHLMAADERERTLPYALLAGDQAEAVYAHAEAERSYRTGLTLAQELHDQESEALALEKLGVVLSLVGRNDEAIALLESALVSYDALGDEQAELRSLAALLEIQGLYGLEMADEAIARAQAILARLEPADPSALAPARASGLAAVYRGLSAVYLGSGRLQDEIRVARRAADLARVAGDEGQLAWALHRLFATALAPETLVARQEILALAERSGQSIIVVFSHNRVGALYAEEGDFVRGMMHMEQSVAVAEQRRDLVHLAWQLSNFTDFLFTAGDWARMRETSARAETIMREADPDSATWHAAVISVWPGKIALLEGREGEGRRLLEQTLARMRKVGIAAEFESVVMCPLAEADLLAGAAETARRCLAALFQAPGPLAGEEALNAALLLAWAEGALGQMEQAGDRLASALAAAKPLYRVDALRIQGLLATMRGAWEVAAAALDEALGRSGAMPYPYAEVKALWAYGRLEAARGDSAAAHAYFAQALVICERLGEGLYRQRIQDDLRELKSGNVSSSAE